jgi:hypothetical protein
MSAGVVLASKFGVFAGEAEKQDTVITRKAWSSLVRSWVAEHDVRGLPAAIGNVDADNPGAVFDESDTNSGIGKREEFYGPVRRCSAPLRRFYGCFHWQVE